MSKILPKSTALLAGFFLSILNACGGGSDPNELFNKKSFDPVTVVNIKFAQTHVIPADGLTWSNIAGAAPFVLTGKRDALVLARFGQSDVKNPFLEVWRNKSLVFSIALNPPYMLPRTEGADVPYATDVWSATVPAEFITPGISVDIAGDNYSRSTLTSVTVGADLELDMQILPFLLFGANDANTGLNLNEERVMKMTELIKRQAAAAWPGTVSVVNHPAGKFESNFIVMPPNAGEPAYIAYSKGDVKDNGQLVDAINDLTYQIHQSSGDMSINRVTFSSVIAVDKSASGPNKLAWLGNGVSLPGAGIGTGPNSFDFLLHETGHGMGLGHSRDEYNDVTGRRYPYIGGSLLGSAWGYNRVTNEFRSTLIPPTAPIYKSCRSKSAYKLDENGRCYRLDPMDDATGGSDPSYRFTLFSDFNIARIQRWIQSQIKLDSKSETNFSKWNEVNSDWKQYTPSTDNFGLDKIKDNVPVVRNVPLSKIVLAYSNAATLGVSRFYPPIAVIGNSIETIDPTDPRQLDKIYPYPRNGRNAEYMKYCHRSGCDFTVRLTYSDGSVFYRLLKGGFRQSFNPETFGKGVIDPTKSASFRVWAIDIPNPSLAKISKLELLDTSLVWTMSPAQIHSAPILLSENY